MSTVLLAGGGTGGHLYPALAIGAALQQARPGTQVHYIGAERGVEARVLPQQQVPHTLLPLQPIRREQVWQNWRLLPALSSSALGLGRVFRQLRPDLVVGTGGYASGPACLFGVLAGVPMALQEQNAHPGLTTRLLARWARQVHLGFPEAARQLKPGRHTEILNLGNPIRVPPAVDRGEARREFRLAADSTVLLVVGGSQGARAVNTALLDGLERVAAGQLHVPAGLEILWATGPAHLDAVRQRLQQLPRLEWVHAVGYIDAMPRALAACDLALSRAGAMATAELLAAGVPMLLVPLPTAAADHQTFNAVALADAGAALNIAERELTPDRLWQELNALAGDGQRRAAMRAAALQRARPQAAREIAEQLLRLVRS